MTKALTTGWEPELAVDDTIARRVVHAYADRTAAMAHADLAHEREAAGVHEGVLPLVVLA